MAYLTCAGGSIVTQSMWAAVKNMVDSWVDLELKQARVIANVYKAIDNADALEEHIQDCGFGVAIILLVSIRAVDYDYGQEAARAVFLFLRSLLTRLEPYSKTAQAAGWYPEDLRDLKIYPTLLGLDPIHNCYNTKLRFFVYTLHDWTPAGNAERGVLHCQHGRRSRLLLSALAYLV